MIVLGLTGSIGMGKSATARLFAEEGVPTYDSDAAVHALYDRGGAAVGPVGAAFPGTVKGGVVDREALAKAVAGQPDALSRLEALVHPLVAEGRDAFLARASAQQAPVVVLDIPLLFETGLQDQVDAVVVASAPGHVQRRRVLERPGMTAEKLDVLLGRQTPDHEKRARADFLVHTDAGLEPARAEVRQILATVTDPAWRSRRSLAASGEPPHR